MAPSVRPLTSCSKKKCIVRRRRYRRPGAGGSVAVSGSVRASAAGADQDVLAVLDVEDVALRVHEPAGLVERDRAAENRRLQVRVLDLLEHVLARQLVARFADLVDGVRDHPGRRVARAAVDSEVPELLRRLSDDRLVGWDLADVRRKGHDVRAIDIELARRVEPVGAEDDGLLALLLHLLAKLLPLARRAEGDEDVVGIRRDLGDEGGEVRLLLAYGVAVEGDVLLLQLRFERLDKRDRKRRLVVNDEDLLRV